jgi:hypothetical protein
VWLVHAKNILIILAVMFASSVTLNVIVYRQTKNYLSESQCYAPSTNDDFQIQNVNIIFDVDGNVIDSLELVAVGNDNNGVPGDYSIPMTPMSIHVNREKLGQMEMEATRTLIIGVTSLAVTALPPTIFVSTCEPIQLQPNELVGAVHDRAGSRQHCLQSLDLFAKEQRVEGGTDMSMNLTQQLSNK